ncbi:uncharacterized protein [Amphiura filiformis]|uniref:uncharacterized protein n=1 Tax=Amphiura filiformis TaxID=82378 RepID=UPI003B214CB7
MNLQQVVHQILLKSNARIEQQMSINTPYRLQSDSTRSDPIKMAESLKGHTKSEVYLRPHMCIYCQRFFHDIRQYLRHRRRHEQQIHRYWYNCKKKHAPTHPMELPNTNDLNEQIHIQDERAKINTLKNKYYKCRYCKQDFKYLGNLITHEHTHHYMPWPYHCQCCKLGFSKFKHLKKHHKKIHKIKIKPRRACQYCKKRFRRHSDLENHERKMDCKCQYCKKSFLHYYDLANHDCKTPYKCRHCKEVFEHLGDLTTHEKDHFCQFCAKRFPAIAQVKEHVQFTHNGSRYRCTFCNEGFQCSNDLLRHEQTHRKLKNFHCQYCNKAYAQASTLEKHEQIHTINASNPVNKCQYCQKGFPDKANLTEHEKTHTQEKPFKCHHCQKGCSTAGGLNVHKRWMHRDAYTNQ